MHQMLFHVRALGKGPFVRRAYRERLLRDRVPKGDGGGVQQVAGGGAERGEHRRLLPRGEGQKVPVRLPVQLVPQEGVAEAERVHADLVRPAREKLHFAQRQPSGAADGREARVGALATVVTGHADSVDVWHRVGTSSSDLQGDVQRLLRGD